MIHDRPVTVASNSNDFHDLRAAAENLQLASFVPYGCRREKDSMNPDIWTR